MNIGKVLEERRSALGLSQSALAERLERYDVRVTKHAVTKWEKGRVVPNALQLLALCRALEIRDVLGEFCGEGETLLAGLNRKGRERVAEYAALLRLSDEFRAMKSGTEPLRVLPLYDLAVSAGTGQFLDGENYELREVGPEVPEGADYGVRVAGDSMEPRYYDHQAIWVRQQNTLMSGEIGIFVYDGSSYVKKLVESDGELRLHSLNPAYADIVVSDALPLQVLGKVLS